MKVFLASANAKKIVEMQRILAEHVLLDPSPGLGERLRYLPCLPVLAVGEPADLVL